MELRWRLLVLSLLFFSRTAAFQPPGPFATRLEIRRLATGTGEDESFFHRHGTKRYATVQRKIQDGSSVRTAVSEDEYRDACLRLGYDEDFDDPHGIKGGIDDPSFVFRLQSLGICARRIHGSLGRLRDEAPKERPRDGPDESRARSGKT
mmetsp:Transcript_21562/g.69434  ORF Transcript_21562/g.69434 Transcript_21562/m.69434 type:complete len:150 (-) Transcript_21562:536-985(-)